MEWEKYDVMKDPVSLEYLFYSEGPRGKIRKIVKFQRIEGIGRAFFNLYFGDFDEATGKINDMSISNNNDKNKILFTVADVVNDFMKSHKNAILLAVGSTKSRTRLYQMGISFHWTAINQQYEIFGELENGWVPFKRGVNYDKFLLFRKSN